MSIFKKKEEKKCCCCSVNADDIKKAQEKVSVSAVKVLGSGCKKCNDLEANAKEALASLGLSVEIEHVRDFAEIASYGVMTTPALMINNKVVSTGKLLKVEEIVAILKKELLNA